MFEPWRNVANFFSSGYIPAAPAIWSDKGRVETNGGMHGVYRQYGSHSGVYRIQAIANASEEWQNRVFLQDRGGIFIDEPGTYTWTIPNGIGNIDAVVIAAGGGGAGNANPTTGDVSGQNPSLSGGGGAGGGLMWRNSIPVNAGDTLTIVVGAGGIGGTRLNATSPTAGGDSYIQTSGGTDLVKATGGSPGLYNSTGTSTGGQSQHTTIGFGGGGSGGSGGTATAGNAGGGGGGAAGYSGNGGNGGSASSRPGGSAAPNSGGGGGGSATNSLIGISKHSFVGGGVAPYGIGNTGTNTSSNFNHYGKDGSGGLLGLYGAGGGGAEDDNAVGGADGKPGVVRIVFAANPNDRAFPSTNVGIDYSGLNEITFGSNYTI